MNDIIYAFYMTMELWIFLAILCAACGVEELIRFYKAKTVDNPTLR